MYLIIRCRGCRNFTYADRFQEWRLCPVCGEAIEIRKSRGYLEVDDYETAERVIEQIEQYLHRQKRRDLSAEEIAQLRNQYNRWLREQT